MFARFTRKQILTWVGFTLAAVIPFLYITSDYFAYAGFSLSLIALATLLFYQKPEKTLETKIWYTLSLTFALIFVVRVNNPFISILNFFAEFYCLSLLLLQTKPEIKYKFWNLALAPFLALFQAFRVNSEYYPNFLASMLSGKKTKSEIEQDVKKYSEKEKSAKVDIAQIAIGVGITLFLLLIIIPLLASVNPFFDRYVDQVMHFFNPYTFISNVLRTVFDIWNVLRFILFCFLVILIPKSLSYLATGPSEEEYKITTFTHHLALLIPKIVISLTLFVFFISQIQLYFSSQEELLQLGYNYGQLNNEVFGQLAVVSLILFGLVYFDKSIKKLNTTWNWILLIQTLFLNFIAAKSVFDYISNWGLTFLRLYGITMVTLIFGIFVLFVIKFIKKTPDFRFLRNVAIYIFLLLITVNGANFDFIIYKYNLPREAQGTVYRYYNNLSYDAFELDQILAQFETLESENKGSYTHEINDTLDKINYLQQKYKNFQFRSFNITEYAVYQKVKDIDVAAKYQSE